MSSPVGSTLRTSAKSALAPGAFERAGLASATTAVQARRRAGQRAEGDVRDDEQRTVAEVGEFAFDPVVLRVRAVEAARGASDGSGDAGRTACSGGSAR